MDADAWIAVAGAAVAVAAIPAAYLSARYGRSQAESARKGVTADTRSSYATWSAARIAKETFDREDRPEFEYTTEPGAEGVIAVTLKAVTGPPRIKVDASWISVCYWQDGIAREERMAYKHEPIPVEVRRGESFGFPVAIDVRATSGTVTFDLICYDVADDARGWDCPVLVEWDQRPPNIW